MAPYQKVGLCHKQPSLLCRAQPTDGELGNLLHETFGKGKVQRQHSEECAGILRVHFKGIELSSLVLNLDLVPSLAVFRTVFEGEWV